MLVGISPNSKRNIAFFGCRKAFGTVMKIIKVTAIMEMAKIKGP